MAERDLNDARVEALKVATDAGMDLVTFNRIWSIIVPAALKSRSGSTPKGGNTSD